MLNLLDSRTHLDDELYDQLSPAMRDELNLILASIKVPTARPQAEIDKWVAEEDVLVSWQRFRYVMKIVKAEP